jgi:Arc-like DNA binding domain
MEDQMARKAKYRTELVNLRLRMPEGLRQDLADAAEKANRSLNSEILWRLGQTFGEEWQRFVAGMEEKERSLQEWGKRVREDPEFEDSMLRLIKKHLPGFAENLAKKREPGK